MQNDNNVTEAPVEAPIPETEAERLALYHELTSQGLSDAEAQGTAWPETPAHRADAIVDAWFAQKFHNLGPMLSTELHNLLQKAKEDLKTLLHAL